MITHLQVNQNEICFIFLIYVNNNIDFIVDQWYVENSIIIIWREESIQKTVTFFF